MKKTVKNMIHSVYIYLYVPVFKVFTSIDAEISQDMYSPQNLSMESPTCQQQWHMFSSISWITINKQNQKN